MSPWEAAELLRWLPASSRLVRISHPEDAWPEDREYFALIEFWLHSLIWAQAKKSSRGPKPKPLVPDSLLPKRRIAGVAMSLDDIDALFHVKTE